jgi:lipoprotein NlpI
MRKRVFAFAVLFAAVGPVLALLPSGAGADELSVCDGGIAAQKAGDLKKAVAAYGECLADSRLGDTDKIIAHYNRGRAYAALGQNWKATQDFTAVIQLQPDNADALYARGVLYQEGGELNFAIQDYATAISHDENYYQAYRARGTAFMEKGDKDFALQDLNRAVALDDSSAESFNDRGFFYLSQGDYEKAKTDFDRAIALKPDFALAIENRGHLDFFQGHYEEAAKSFADALKADSSDAYAAIWLYLAQARASDKDALETLKKNAATLDRETWPGPVLSLFLGQATPDEIAAMTAEGHRHLQQVRHAEGLFYIGEDKLLKDDKAAAIADFQAAAKTAMLGEIEVVAAKAELQRL